MKEKKNSGAPHEGEVVVKNKKIKGSDIFVLVVCLILSFIIWIYAENLEKSETAKLEELQEGLKTEQTVK